MSLKQDLREEARRRRTALAAAVPQFASAVAHFADELDLPAGAVVASYWPVRDEADPRGLAAALAGKGHPVALPRIVRDGALEFRLWIEGEALSPNRHGVHEPHPRAGIAQPAAVLVPLLAYDGTGARLGYGGGHYDRALAHLRARGHIVAVGVAYSGQEVNVLPHDLHDQRLDKVVTENGIRIFGTK